MMVFPSLWKDSIIFSINFFLCYSPINENIISLSLAWSSSNTSTLCHLPSISSPSWTGIVSLAFPMSIPLICACPLRHSSLLSHIVLGSLCSRSLCLYISSIEIYLSHRSLRSFRNPSSASLILSTAVVWRMNSVINQFLAQQSVIYFFISSVISMISNGFFVWYILFDVWYISSDQ